MDPDEDNIGARLRAARERRNLTIAECAERTRIRAKYLHALEEEEFGMLPEVAYARSFLRTYASSLGIEPTQLTKIFDRLPEHTTSHPNAVDLEARDAPRPHDRRARSGRRGGRRGALWALAGAVIAIGLLYLAARGLAAPAATTPIDAAAYFSR